MRLSFVHVLAVVLGPALGSAQETRPPDKEKLQAIGAQVAPDIERVTGVRFPSAPKFRITTRQELEEILTAELAPQMRAFFAESKEEEHSRAAAEQAKLYGTFLVAKYEFRKNTIHLVPSTLKKNAELLKNPRLLEEDILRVILTHELVHSLDEQAWGIVGRLGKAKTQAELEILNALMEGHAQYVTRKVLEAKKEGPLFEEYQKMILAGPPGLGEAEKYLASVLTQSLKYAYLDGRAFFEGLEKSGRKTFAQDAFSSPPPTKNGILHPEDFYKPREASARAFDFTPVFSEFGEPFGQDWARQVNEVDESGLRTVFGNFVDPKAVDEAIKGMRSGKALALAPKDAPQSKLVVILLCQMADADGARKFYDLFLALSRAKDERMAKGPIRITASEYKTLKTRNNLKNTAATKTVAFGDQEVKVRSLVACFEEFYIEMLFTNEEVAEERLAGYADKVCGALKKK